MNYEQMTDQQINDEIIKLRRLDAEWHRWDFCNSWDDMGTLITERKISLIQFSDSDECVAYSMNFKDNRVTHVNPLRAAAIAWLMCPES